MTPPPALSSSEPSPLLSRRRLLVRAGLSTLAVGALAGCTNYGKAAAPASIQASVTVPTSEVPVGSGKIYADAQAVITQPTAGVFKAFSSICTHHQCPLASVTTTINCNCHGSQFSITDGSVVHDPATSPLPAKKVKVSGGNVTVSS